MYGPNAPSRRHNLKVIPEVRVQTTLDCSRRCDRVHEISSSSSPASRSISGDSLFSGGENWHAAASQHIPGSLSPKKRNREEYRGTGTTKKNEESPDFYEVPSSSQPQRRAATTTTGSPVRAPSLLQPTMFSDILHGTLGTTRSAAPALVSDGHSPRASQQSSQRSLDGGGRSLYSSPVLPSQQQRPRVTYSRNNGVRIAGKTSRAGSIIRDGSGVSLNLGNDHSDDEIASMRRNRPIINNIDSDDDVITKPISKSNPLAEAQKLVAKLNTFTTEGRSLFGAEENTSLPRLDVLSSDGTNYALSSPTASQIQEIDKIERLAAQEESRKLLLQLESLRTLTKCPLCGEPLSDDMREKFSGLKHSLRRSYAICKYHQRVSVMRDAAGKNYPTYIDEHDLQSRAERVSEILPAIINGTHPSAFLTAAEALTTSSHTGRRLDALQQLEGGQHTLLPGYYGVRGSSILLRVALAQSESLIRRAAKTQKWISKLSITGYAMSVLVPEMAVLLIMEDQHVDAEAAEKIRQDSVDFGRLVFPGTDDDDEEEDNTDNYTYDVPITKSKHKKSSKKSMKQKSHLATPNSQNDPTTITSTMTSPTTSDSEQQHRILLSSSPLHITEPSPTSTSAKFIGIDSGHNSDSDMTPQPRKEVQLRQAQFGQSTTGSTIKREPKVPIILDDSPTKPVKSSSKGPKSSKAQNSSSMSSIRSRYTSKHSKSQTKAASKNKLKVSDFSADNDVDFMTSTTKLQKSKTDNSVDVSKMFNDEEEAENKALDIFAVMKKFTANG
ncbi:RTC4-like domain-containing protein [Limtongia smithiae]|uniref:RTC4-like domain-containing protein n=1 Tax=Limtongia smithiae TaxID=1125753 RepID=UPI0034CE4FF6